MTMAWRALAAAVALLSAALAQPDDALAQSYPAKSVRLIVPFAAGNTGVTMVARAPADGYTILVVSTGFIVNPSMYTKISNDPLKDFAPITLVAASPNLISVNPDFPAKSLKELVALVKANPGKYSFAQPA